MCIHKYTHCLNYWLVCSVLHQRHSSSHTASHATLNTPFLTLHYKIPLPIHSFNISSVIRKSKSYPHLTILIPSPPSMLPSDLIASLLSSSPCICKYLGSWEVKEGWEVGKAGQGEVVKGEGGSKRLWGMYMGI